MACINPTTNSSIDSEKKEAYIELSNGQKCPLIALGTFLSDAESLMAAITYAIEAGYRHIDCAPVYGNEKPIGQALKKNFDEGNVKREDMFIVSKLWNTCHKAENVEPSLRKSLADLQLDCLDLYLIHWPLAYQDQGCELFTTEKDPKALYKAAFPKDKDGKTIYSKVTLQETWKAMEKCVEKGLTKSIGVANFNSKQIEDILKISKIRPTVNQVECHPYLNQKKLLQFLQEKNIAMAGYAPLGAPNRPLSDRPPNQEDPILLQDEKILELANKYKVSPAQICLRYQIQRGIIILPKSTRKDRINQNYDLFNFNISEEDVYEIDCLDKGIRYHTLYWDKEHKDYPFKKQIEF